MPPDFAFRGNYFVVAPDANAWNETSRVEQVEKNGRLTPAIVSRTDIKSYCSGNGLR